MPYQKHLGAASGKGESRGQNGTRGGFRTDAAISNGRLGSERTLQRWVPDSSDGIDGGLESSGNNGSWDQFAENERRFGIKTDYDENIYTTSIDKSHPQYRERMAAADRKAREIEGSQAATAHVAEERVMDFVGGQDDAVNEEDKYSGVRRQDFPPLGNRENKYTPPARRSPAAQANVHVVPVDPAIISSQVRTTDHGQSLANTEAKSSAQMGGSSAISTGTDDLKASAPTSSKQSSRDEESQSTEAGSLVPKDVGATPNEIKSGDRSSTPLRATASSARNVSPQTKEGTPSAASTVERDVLNSFKTFASQQRQTADKIRTSKAKADKEVKLTELKKFATSFKLSTPVPTDLISIIAKEPSKQKEIQAKALQNAQDVARTKIEPAANKDKEQVEKGKPTTNAAASQGSSAAQSTPRAAPSHYASSPGSGLPNRHANARQSYAAPSHHSQPYRMDRSGQQHSGQQNRQTLGQRLRNVEQQKMSQPPTQTHVNGPEMRAPPTGPANPGVDSNYGRRLSGAPISLGAKLNPNSHEFRPNPFATAFSPNGGHPSNASSPRSAVANNVPDASSVSPVGQLIRRQTKAIDVKKCYILAHVKTFQPPQGRNWDDNDGFRPSYDTLPTWRQIQEEGNEKTDSTMRLTYKEFLEQQSFTAPSSSTPNQPQVASNLPHHYQLPLHLQQQGAHGMATRQSPNMPSMPLHGQHGHGSHPPFNGMDDHRMMHSNSAQSFASPRMSQQVPMNYAPAINSPAPNPYSQPMMQPYVGPGTPQMGQYRNFNNPQYMQQPGHMSGPVMMQPQFMTPQGMVPTPQMPMYGGHAQFIPPNGGPPQPIPGSNGYPSPGRPSAPMMAHQGSHQGQGVYGMSPNVQYQQPAFAPQQPGGQGGRGYNTAGPQQFGTSPQQIPSYGGQHRGGSNYGGKHFNTHSQQQGSHQNHTAPGNASARASESPSEAK